ncbi:MAG: peptidylprolyl isomerase [Myxococcota bacterium]
MRPLWPAFAAVGVLALFGCPKEDGPKDDPRVVATVNGEVISRVDFERELSRELTTLELGGARPPAQLEPLKRALLRTLLERTLLLQAAKAANVEVPPEEVDRRVLRLSADFPAEGFDEVLAQGQTPLAELKRQTSELIAIEKLFAEHVYPRVAVTEEEIRQHYEKNSEAYTEPETVRAAQIVVKELDEAKRVQAQLRAGKKFSDLARRYSLSPDAKVGGDLGWFSRGVMPPGFDEVVFRLSVNQVSEVVDTEYGFHLFKVMEKRPERKRELSEVRRQVEERLLADKRAAAQAEYVRALEQKARVRVNEQALLAASGKPAGPAEVATP